jgi:hypothetical protein
MAEGDVTFYNSFYVDLMNGVHDLTNDTIKVTLHTSYTPNIDTHGQWSDVSATEYGTGDNYTAGGDTPGSQVVTQDNTDDQGEFDMADPAWTALGPLTPATPSHAIVWNDSATNDELICYIELGTTATNGGDYSLALNATGLFYLKQV